MGFNKYKSALNVWLEKTGELPPQEENQHMKMGHMLEPIVTQLFAEEHPELKVQKNNFLLQHDEYEFMLANIDREIICPFRGRGVFEAKTTSDWNKHLWTETQIPESYMLQVQWYLSVTGYKFAYIAVLIGGVEYRSYLIERDDELIETMIAMAVAFWIHVVENTPPPVDGSESARDALEDMNRPEDACEELQILPDALSETLIELEAIKVQLEVLEKRKGLLNNQLMQAMDNHTNALVGDYKVSWKPQMRTSFDAKRFKEEMPEVHQQYVRTSVVRPLTIRRSKS